MFKIFKIKGLSLILLTILGWGSVLYLALEQVSK